MTYSAPPGWYADPTGSGGLRWYDGANWTGHQAPPVGPPTGPPPPYGWWPPANTWKGAAYGLPPEGPGSLANPGRRLAARLLDVLVFLPVYGALIAVAVIVAVRNAGPIFPNVTTNPDGTTAPVPTPGILWIYLAVFVALAVGGGLMVAYETIATARYGRTLGKAWMHIRPLQTTGDRLGWPRALGRAAFYCFAGWLNWLGLLDSLWCLWDNNSQCLHDKVANTVVISDTGSGLGYQPPNTY